MKKETPETKVCKHCKSQIPYDARVCPQCRKKVKGGKLKWILLILLGLFLSSAIFGNHDDNSPKKVGQVNSDQSQSSASSSQAQQTEYRVGDILQDGDMKIVYAASGIYEEDNELLQPDEGYQYIYLTFAFENISEARDASVSFYSFSCYADGYAADMHYSVDDALSASLSAGRATTGTVCFAVPVDANEIEVEYETNLFTSEKIHFLFEGNQDSGYTPPKNTERSENASQVGDMIETDQLRITYLSSETFISDNQFVQPRPGYRFVSASFEFENISSSDQYVGYMDFDGYADGMDCKGCYIRDDALDATLSAGRKTKGTVTFEVPADASVIEFEFQPNSLSSQHIVFAVE